jgi:nucleoprotein TPR
LHRQIEAERVAFEKERKTFEDGMAALRSADQQARDAQIAAQDDMRRQAQVARDAHEKYERELVAHAEDVKRLSEVKGELEAIRATVREHQAAADTAKANLLASEESWKRQKDVLHQELADVRKRCVPTRGGSRRKPQNADFLCVTACRSDELKEQNGILADHLEKATASAATLQSRHATNTDDASGSSATPDSIEAITASHNSSVEQLREVIRYLRREKDIIDLQLDFSKQEATRLRQQLDFTSRSLEEARQTLQEVSRLAMRSRWLELTRL